MAPKVKYAEGDWFAVPLRDEGFAVGIVARAKQSHGVLLGYFFGPRYAHVPPVASVTNLHASQAVLVSMFGDLALRRGRWRILGHKNGWDRGEWPMPAFYRYEELMGRSFLVFYADDDPNQVVREEQITPASRAQLPDDGVLGAGAAEILLARLLPANR